MIRKLIRRIRFCTSDGSFNWFEITRFLYRRVIGRVMRLCEWELDRLCACLYVRLLCIFVFYFDVSLLLLDDIIKRGADAPLEPPIICSRGVQGGSKGV